jgi:hypothetical protein
MTSGSLAEPGALVIAPETMAGPLARKPRTA